MVNAEEILFASMFAAALIGLAVYFVYLSAFVGWRRLASPFFCVAVITSCAWLWSLCAAGFMAYCSSSALQLRHTHASSVLWDIMGVFLFVALGAFLISFAALAIGLTESLLRGRPTI